jgi:hypothetical protein
MHELVVHQIDITHYRLIELVKLADQAKPFYDWVEKQARLITGSHRSLNEILFQCSQDDIAAIVRYCYSDSADDKPILFDGIGRAYPHGKACFYFFAWMIRDAPQQRLASLITRMQKAENIAKLTAEIDTLAGLIFEYRNLVRTFDWRAIREVILDRLEGSRRSSSGHKAENFVRTALVTALQYYYSVHNDYGNYKRVVIADKQIKIGAHTVDVSVDLCPKIGNDTRKLLIPVKTRETEGGGHSHLFTRDVIAAINDLKPASGSSHIIAVIIAENWSASELQTIGAQIDLVFHFNMSPNKFMGFDEDAQIRLNKYIASILGGQDVVRT